jgi:outer membrane protein assembly factor BamB
VIGRSFHLLALTLLAGCGIFGGDDDVIEPPAELVDFDHEIEISRLWSTRIGGKSERLRLALSPATDGATIFAGSFDGRVQALNADTGRALWATRTDDFFTAGPGYGNGALVFATADGELVMLDARDGAERWRVPVGSEVMSTPVVSNNIVVFHSIDGRLRGLSATDGEALWTVEHSLPALTMRGDTPPKVTGTIVVSGFDNGRIGAYQISTGQAVWEVPIANSAGTNDLERLVDIGVGIQIVGNEVYTAGYHGRAVGIDLRSGIVTWAQEISSFAGIGVDAGSVYVTDEVGAIVALDRRTGMEVWRQEALRLRDVTAASRFGQTLVVGDFEGYLHWLDPRDGRFLARAKAVGDRITAAPLVVGRAVFVQGDDGTVAAYTVVDDESA